MKNSNEDRIIDALGGTGVVAEMCEVSAPAVSQWRDNGIPKAQLRYLKLAKRKIFKQLSDQEV